MRTIEMQSMVDWASGNTAVEGAVIARIEGWMDSGTAPMKKRGRWWKLATQRSVVVRAARYAVVVGAVLIAINHGDAIETGALTPRKWVQMSLTVLVPYTVSTLSSVGATLQALRDRERE